MVGELFYARRLSRPEREDHAMPPLIGAALDNPAQYVGWGWLQISVPNLIVIIVMKHLLSWDFSLTSYSSLLRGLLK